MILGPDGKPVTSRPTVDEVFAKDHTRMLDKLFVNSNSFSAMLRAKIIKPDGTWATPVVFQGSHIDWPIFP